MRKSKPISPPTFWTLNGERAARMQSYWERADALEAVGLSE